MAEFVLDITAKIPILRVGGYEKHYENNMENNHLDLPKPSFRKIAPMKRTHTAAKFGQSKDCYYHYVEPTQEELDKRVEYDMDLEDIKWLEKFNNKYAVKALKITDGQFEKVMDRLEKESYFESVQSGQNSKPDVDEDAVCAICDNGDCHNTNVIIFCDMCDLAVHQECYGVPYVPLGQWLCKRCQLSPSQNVECCLCPNLGGAFKQTELTEVPNIPDHVLDKKKPKFKTKKGWAHVVCALWVPEVAFANTVFLEPIEGIENIDLARWKLKCYICNQRYKGACIQCSRPNCYQPFHVTCAKQAGLFMRISPFTYERDGETFSDVRRHAYCDKHTPAGENQKGGMYSGDESDEDFDSERYRKKELFRKRNMKKTREKLAKQFVQYQREAALVKVEDDKLVAIARELNLHKKRNAQLSFNLEEIGLNYVKRIHGYWLNKRKARNGVPLLRRLQVTFSPRTDLRIDRSQEEEKYTHLRYDLEKARMLLNLLIRREQLKRRAIRQGIDIIKLNFDIIDKDQPADED